MSKLNSAFKYIRLFIFSIIINISQPYIIIIHYAAENYIGDHILHVFRFSVYSLYSSLSLYVYISLSQSLWLALCVVSLYACCTRSHSLSMTAHHKVVLCIFSFCLFFFFCLARTLCIYSILKQTLCYFINL